MDEDLQAFIRRVEVFDIDPGDKRLRFADRLARENNWSLAFAERVIREYKRFCILAMRAGHPVTPSEEVDQAWHLHLTYTRSYWDRFCRDGLGGPLHHEPTAGGAAEGSKFRDWYRETLDSYQRLFGEQPPTDIWPLPEMRFQHAGDWKWVNTGRYWMVPRPMSWWPVAGVLLLLLGLMLPGCKLAIGKLAFGSPVFAELLGADGVVNIFPFNLSGSGFLLFYIAVWIVALSAATLFRARFRRHEEMNEPSDSPPKLSPDELAVLAGGAKRLAQVSLTRLYVQQSIKAFKKLLTWKFEASGPEPEAHGLDRDLFNAIRSRRSTVDLLKAVKPHYERIDARLQIDGLRHTEAALIPMCVAITLAITGLGLLRFLQGLLAQEEVMFLVLATVVGCVAGLLIAYRPKLTTAKGNAAVEHYRRQAEDSRIDLQLSKRPTSSAAVTAGSSHIQAHSPDARSDNTDTFALCVAVLGASVIADVPELNPLSAAIPQFGSTHNSGGGGGCGGGGCGGGGGGCGGCGG